MMDWKKLLLAVPVLALSFAPAAEAKHKKDNNWQRYSDQRYRYRYNDNNRYNNGYRYGYGPRSNGLDRNRDGVIERYEWRGNNRSFQRQDRNGDGLISPRDRYQYDRNNDYYRYYRR